MKKNERITAFVDQLSPEVHSDPALSPHYTGYFHCFNAQLYYEAHDVLEHLWLRCTDENWLFYKGLIQFAGGYVHLQKQHLYPLHAKHGRRLRPASRLFLLAAKNLAPYGPRHLRLDVEAVCRTCAEIAEGIVASGYARNPWAPERAPRVELLVESC
jgi:hypothetical protein